MTSARRVRAVALVVLATSACAWASAAAPPTALAAAVSGGGSFDDAPLLRAGTFRDTILPQETLFYAVAVGEGQRLRVDADVDLSGGSKGERGDADALGGFGLTLYSPLRERLATRYVGAALRGGPDLQSDGDSRLGPRVLGAAAADRRKTAGTGDWIGPGIYAFTAAISAIYDDPGAAVEFPMRLRVTIDGPAVAADEIGAGPLGEVAAARPPFAGGRATAPAGRGASASARNRIGDGVLLAVGLGALVAGALLAGLAARIPRSGART
jgi:hypothetical protein